MAMLVSSFFCSAAILALLSVPLWAWAMDRSRTSSLSLRTLFLILPTCRASAAEPLAAAMASLKPPVLTSASSAVVRAALMMAASAGSTFARSFSSI